MNVNYFVKCRICNTITRIRIPMGYINQFPIRIHCGTCKNIISGYVNILQKFLENCLVIKLKIVKTRI